MKPVNHKFPTSLLTSAFVFATVTAGMNTATASDQPDTSDKFGLIEVYRLAMNNDPGFAQAQLQLKADEESIQAIKGNLYPQLNASANYTKSDGPSASSDVDSTEYALTLNQSIYQHDVWALYDQSKKAIRISQLDVRSAQQNLILNVAEAYFNVLLAKQNLELFETKEKSDLTQLESAKASAEVGLASRVDVLQAQSSYDLSRSDRISAENSLDIAKEALAKIIGRDVNENRLKYLGLSTEIPYQPMEMGALEQKAKLDNLAVRQAKAQLEVALQEIEVQKAGHWPRLSVQARLSDNQYSGNVNNQDGTNSSISFNLSVPIYSGGTTSANIASSKYQKEVSQQQLRDAVDSARLEARTQLRNIQQGQNLIAALHEAVKSNDAFLEAAEEGYKVGLKDLLEVLSARSNQVQARKNLIEAMHNQILNFLRLESALGDLTPEDLRQYNVLLKS